MGAGTSVGNYYSCLQIMKWSHFANMEKGRRGDAWIKFDYKSVAKEL